MTVDSEPSLALSQARRAIAEFPQTGEVTLLMEAVNEVVDIQSGLDLEIPLPTENERRAIDTAADKGIPHLLVYSIGLMSGRALPGAFTRRLSSVGFDKIDRGSLEVKAGWRIIDPRTRQNTLAEYKRDKNYLGKIINRVRRDGDVAALEGSDMEDLPHSSRRGLIPSEINAYIIPKAEVLLGMPTGSMRLPTLREAMVLSLLYEFTPLNAREWQTARLAFYYSDEYPAGLIYSHQPGDGYKYYDVRTQFEHRRDLVTGFRLIGQIPQ